ncbi:FkbM family methyltransferase [Candidatus Pelagibacter sp. HIMB1483]|uniref:FkbM family methyltransferase n=1 Tax=Candidatus Pelagibacter sp. HIMB1483 TaxID=3415414 RepID=UPI003F82A27A
MIPSYLKPYHTDLSNLVRLGRKYDGGYVIDKRVIAKTKVIISCGLEAEWSFEREFQKYNRNCKIIAFDHTVDKNFWINRFVKDFISLLLLKKIKFYQIFDVFKYLEYSSFFGGKNKHYLKKIVSKKKDKNKQITITEAIGENKDIVLKIDIEGDEYKVLKEVNRNFDKLNLVIIEFHDLQKNLKKIKSFIKKTKLKNIHINVNNYGMFKMNDAPQTIEMTLINPNKFKIKNTKTKRSYPINGLDFKNWKRGPKIQVVFNK